MFSLILWDLRLWMFGNRISKMLLPKYGALSTLIITLPWIRSSLEWFVDLKASSEVTRTSLINLSGAMLSFSKSFRSVTSVFFSVFWNFLKCGLSLVTGLAFFNEHGEFHSCYQFNFKFNIQEDMFAKDSIDLLQVRSSFDLWHSLSSKKLSQAVLLG